MEKRTTYWALKLAQICRRADLPAKQPRVAEPIVHTPRYQVISVSDCGERGLAWGMPESEAQIIVKHTKKRIVEDPTGDNQFKLASEYRIEKQQGRDL